MDRSLPLLLLIIFSSGCLITDQIEKESESIRESEIDRITKETTEQIIDEKTAEIEDQLLGVKVSAGEYVCNLAPKERELDREPYYDGPLNDAHVHLPVSSELISSIAIQSGFTDMPAFDDTLTSDYLRCLFTSENVTNAYGFYLAPNLVISQTVRTTKTIDSRHPGVISPFFMPTPINSLNPEPDAIESVLTNNPGLYKGIGEIALEEADFSLMAPDDFRAYFDLAKRHDLVIMIHPRSEHRDEMEQIFKEYPDVNFLLHGGGTHTWIVDVLKDHENAYFSLDADISSMYGHLPEHEVQPILQEDYHEHVREHYDQMLDDVLALWKPRIEENPDKYLWATDRWFRWHFDHESSGLVIEFGRAFIGALGPEVQEKFAYKNAEKLLR